MTLPNVPPLPAHFDAVALARIEGKLDLALFQITDHAGRIGKLEEGTTVLRSETQRLASDAIARDLQVEAAARALRQAKESEEAATRAEVARSDKSWTPFARTMTVVAVLTSVLSLYLYSIR